MPSLEFPGRNEVDIALGQLAYEEKKRDLLAQEEARRQMALADEAGARSGRRTVGIVILACFALAAAGCWLVYKGIF